MSPLPPGYHDAPLVAPSPQSVAAEAWVVRELPRLLLRSPRLLRVPRGDGEPVMVLPGHSSTDAWTVPLRAYLRRLGYDAHGWGLGTNHGDVAALLPPVTEQVEVLARRAGRPVHLLGWSLGGVLAREVARDRPDLVAQVITYGTPVVGGPAYTLARDSYTPEQISSILVRVAEREQVPIPVPVTAFFSRRDRVVAWRACIDTANDVDHVEVSSTHIGLGLDPDVWEGVARLLRQAPTP